MPFVLVSLSISPLGWNISPSDPRPSEKAFPFPEKLGAKTKQRERFRENRPSRMCNLPRTWGRMVFTSKNYSPCASSVASRVIRRFRLDHFMLLGNNIVALVSFGLFSFHTEFVARAPPPLRRQSGRSILAPRQTHRRKNMSYCVFYCLRSCCCFGFFKIFPTCQEIHADRTRGNSNI